MNTFSIEMIRWSWIVAAVWFLVTSIIHLWVKMFSLSSVLDDVWDKTEWLRLQVNSLLVIILVGMTTTSLGLSKQQTRYIFPVFIVVACLVGIYMLSPGGRRGVRNWIREGTFYFSLAWIAFISFKNVYFMIS